MSKSLVHEFITDRDAIIKDEDEGHHQSGRVLVMLGVCVHELCCAFYLDPDGAIAEEHPNEESDLKCEVEHFVYRINSCSFIDEITSS